MIGWPKVDLNAAAAWASIVSLLISAYNAIQITSVRRNILLNVTLPLLLERLRENSKVINGHLLIFDGSADGFEEVIGLCEANVRAVRRRLGYFRGWFCRRMLKAIVRHRRRRSVDSARSVYNALQQLIQEVANRAEERRITGT